MRKISKTKSKTKAKKSTKQKISKVSRRKRNPQLKFNTPYANQKLDYFWKLWLIEVSEIIADRSWNSNKDVPDDKELLLIKAANREPMIGFTVTYQRGAQPLFKSGPTLLAWQERIISVGQQARLTPDEIDQLVEYLTGYPYSGIVGNMI